MVADTAYQDSTSWFDETAYLTSKRMDDYGDTSNHRLLRDQRKTTAGRRNSSLRFSSHH